MPEQASRLIIFFLLLLLAFFVLRPMVIPPSYGLDGRYRAAAADEIKARTPVHQGSAACEICHGEAFASWAEGEHVRVACETCHGAGLEHGRAARAAEKLPEAEARAELAAHALFSPTEKEQPQFCGLCHQLRPGRPGGLCLSADPPDGCPGAFPQVDIPNHNAEDGSCIQADCHHPHGYWE